MSPLGFVGFFVWWRYGCAVWSSARNATALGYGSRWLLRGFCIALITYTEVSRIQQQK
ncbi:hypothetical protein [Paenalcaligenes suwonensis]|uniref:hypothetical protein n=1 Tax=Paenalcaligenes suwonensis TaxID=1202713 RepID=UPI001408DB3D|nr:hypothetical protein [Paenalcaligenes suwonensis]NHC61995.1 hypothetical protein [Paenalcaligenes suwonensis]